MCRRCSEEGTQEMPRPAETRLRVEPMRGACCVEAARLPTRGLKPAAWQAAMVASYIPVPGGPYRIKVSLARRFRDSAALPSVHARAWVLGRAATITQAD